LSGGNGRRASKVISVLNNSTLNPVRRAQRAEQRLERLEAASSLSHCMERDVVEEGD